MPDDEDPITDVQIIRMKNMGPQGDRGWRVQIMRSKGWQVLLEDGTRGQAERIAAEVKRQMQVGVIEGVGTVERWKSGRSVQAD